MILTRIIRTCARKCVSALFVAAAITPTFLLAQSTTTRSDSGWTPHLRLGSGGSLSDDGPIGLIGVDFTRPGSRLTLRATADYSRRTLNYPFNSTSDGQLVSSRDCTTLCTDHERRTAAVFSVDASFDLLTGRFRPYVFSGVGLARTVNTTYLNADCSNAELSCTLTPGEIHPLVNRAVPISLQAGLGASFRVGRAQLFAERGMRSINQTNRPLGWLSPFSIGIRF
jgi:hypothetical protein